MLLDQMICLSFCAVIVLLAVAVGLKKMRDKRIARAWHEEFGHDENEEKIIAGEKEPAE